MVAERVFIMVAIFALLSGCAPVKNTAARQTMTRSDSVNDGIETFGSNKLLKAIWFDEQLSGSERDVARSTLPQPDFRPPERTVPHRLLSPLKEKKHDVITSVSIKDGRKYIALGFDLCERAPHIAGYRREIVNYLRSNGIKATFFAGGKWMRTHPEKAMQLMADPLFELGNHSWTHGNFALMEKSEIRQQVLWTQAQYELLFEQLAKFARMRGVEGEMKYVQPSMRVLRLPYGRNNEQTGKIIAEMGLPMVQWSVEGEQDEYIRSVQELVKWNLGKVNAGAIFLMHANAVPSQTHKLVPALIPELQKLGYEFVTVSELLKLGTAVTVEDGFFDKPGDNYYVDDMFGGRGVLGRVK